MKRRLKIKTQTFTVLALFSASFLFSISVFQAQIENNNTNTQPSEILTENNDTNQDKDVRSLLEINVEIEKKRKEIETLQNKTKQYQDTIKQKQQEAASLSNQVIIIENEIETTNSEIEITQAQIEEIILEIENLELRILTKEAEISVQKNRLSELIRQVNKADKKTYLEITLGYDKFSDFFNQLKFLKEIESKNKDLLDRYKTLKTDLELRKEEQSTKKNLLSDKKIELDQTKGQLDYENSYKKQLLENTQSSEEKFQEILVDLKNEQSLINGELVSLEQTAREKLKLEDRDSSLNQEVGILAWPVSPAGGISAYYHDPTYIYRYIFEHPAIDVRCGQGTPVAASADGYVVRAKNAGLGYSYIMLAHGNELTTVYGHISQIYVQEDTFVERGTIIGLSGGSPGTSGAGRLTTGAHLHFEVRLNGIPVDPLNYLP